MLPGFSGEQMTKKGPWLIRVYLGGGFNKKLYCGRKIMAFLSKKDEGLQVSMGFAVYLRMSVKHMPNRNASLH